MECAALSRWVIGCAIDMHQELSPGLLESTYEQRLALCARTQASSR
jgi:hypothetical protein